MCDEKRFSVSIPFIAGQWSLREIAAREAEAQARVSIPFIAGQWSLPFAGVELRARSAWLFQSPSLRGSGRFRSTSMSAGDSAPRRFNPLHCGAVVASRSQTRKRRKESRVSIPFIAGQWSLHLDRSDRHDLPGRVSIPFIAGQWSLRGGARPASRAVEKFQSPSLRGSGRFRITVRVATHRRPGFNPLHCGAVVASLLSWRWRRCSPPRFNPLHCGAVVASRRLTHRRRSAGFVSIPFIAGQWSLPRNGAPSIGRAVSFQSPSLRGSGRFEEETWLLAPQANGFNPLHCGAVVASRPR